MRSRFLMLLAALAVASGLLLNGGVAHAKGASGPANIAASLPNGATYLIEVPAQWNGTLVLYSHGYVFPGQPKLAPDAPDALTQKYLLMHGYALAGSSYSKQGWALQQAFADQIAVLDVFDGTFGRPARTIAWGDSLGGIITAGLIQLHPDRFTAALPMCGVLAGGVGTWNEALDGVYAFKVLLAGNNPSLQIANITNPTGSYALAQSILAQAQQTPQGRARLALVAALSDLPGWFNPSSPEPAPTDYAARAANQVLWDQQVDFAFLFFARAELEARAGGNPSWNTGVDYRAQLARSVDLDEVVALYRQAGLDLRGDLATLNGAPRIAANPSAVAYLQRYITFDGELRMPVLTMHTTGDGLVVTQQEQAYRDAVDEAGNQRLLRQIYVHRAGHCTFTPAENITAFNTLVRRLDTGSWRDSTDAGQLDTEAAALGSTYNVLPPVFVAPQPPAFVTYHPADFLRPFDTADSHGERAG